MRVSPTLGPQTSDFDRSGVRIRWLGQAGFLIQAAGARLLVDAWFSDEELRVSTRPRMDDLPGAIDWLLASHEHADHLDLDAIVELHARNPSMRVVVPSPIAGRVSERAPGIQVHGVQPGDHVEQPPVRIDVVPAWHGVTVEDGYSSGPEGLPTPHVGYVIGVGGLRIYHSGDTISAVPLVEALSGLGIDIALLPINGRDLWREAEGVLGNLDANEAARLAAAIGARILIPMHYDMVRGNTASAASLVDAVASLGLPVHVIVPSRAHSISLVPDD